MGCRKHGTTLEGYDRSLPSFSGGQEGCVVGLDFVGGNFVCLDKVYVALASMEVTI